MNWQHSTMYLFFGLAGIVSLVVHTTDIAPLALDRLMLAIAFFNEGKKNILLTVLTAYLLFFAQYSNFVWCTNFCKF